MSNTGLKLMTGVLLAITALSLYGCGEGQASKNMEQLYSEKGIPVKTEIVEPRVFVKNLEYNAVITGVKESSAFATLTDKIETINYEVGDLVEKDAVVLTFPTDNPTAQYFQAKLTYKNAEATFDRMKSFYDAGGLSQQDYENAETSFRVA